jgi:hypothetical protein
MLFLFIFLYFFIFSFRRLAAIPYTEFTLNESFFAYFEKKWHLRVFVFCFHVSNG